MDLKIKNVQGNFHHKSTLVHGKKGPYTLVLPDPEASLVSPNSLVVVGFIERTGIKMCGSPSM